MFAYIIQRADGFVYSQGRKFVEPTDKTRPVLYTSTNAASNALTLIAQDDYYRRLAKQGLRPMRLNWYNMSDNEKQEMRSQWAVLRVRLVPEPEGD